MTTVDDFKHQLPDIDEAETADWVDSFDQVLEQEGENRARFLMYKLLKRARQRHVGLPALTQTRYINTISPEQEPYFPGDEELERRIRRLIRWNAVTMVLRANNRFSGIGGHLATYASAASLYEVGFNHFFQGKDHPGGGDQGFLGPRGPGHLRPRVPRGPAHGEPSRPLPARDRGQGPELVPPPAADAGLLGVPDGVDGSRPARRGLPGPLQPLPAEPRPQGHEPAARVGVPRRRRDGRAGVDLGDLARGARRPRQPDVRHQLQPAAARRPGARQREGHPGAGGPLPRRRLERHQGRVGPRVGRAAGARRGRRRWSRR